MKRFLTILLLIVFCGGLSYGYSKNYNQELQEKNAKILEETANKTKRERKQILERQQFEYQKQIREKQEELFFINKQKSTMNPSEKREQIKKLKEEIEDLQRAAKNLR